eukprot:602704-Prorocentrum_minimum.AAC.1
MCPVPRVTAAHFAAARSRVGASVVRGSAVEAIPTSWKDIGGLQETKRRLQQVDPPDPPENQTDIRRPKVCSDWSIVRIYPRSLRLVGGGVAAAAPGGVRSPGHRPPPRGPAAWTAGMLQDNASARRRLRRRCAL